LPYYAILRAVPNKLLGVIMAFGSIFLLFLVPWLDTSPVRSARFRPVYKWVFWLLVIDVIALGWVGANPPEGLVVTVGQIATPLLFCPFADPVPADRQARAAETAAPQYRHRGAAGRRDAPRRCRGADGEPLKCRSVLSLPRC